MLGFVRSRSLVAASVVCLLVHTGAASQRPQFSTRADAVLIDVTVLDRDRRAVAGLVAEDFILLDNGVEQTIETFERVEVADATGAASVPSTDVVTNTYDSRRLFVMVMDDANLASRPSHRRAVLETARDFVARLGPNDLTAVVFTQNNRHAQDFTQDRQRLLAAVERTSYAVSTNPTYNGLSALNTLARVAEYLEPVSTGRKTVAFFSSGFMFDTDLLAQVVLPERVGEVDGLQAQSSLMRAMRRVIDRARRANVSIHAFDPSGTLGMGNTQDFRTPRMFWESLLAIADNTGGRAHLRLNDLRPAVIQFFEEARTYYLLGYIPQPAGRDGQYRRLQVKMRTPGLNAHARAGYFTSRQPADSEADLPLGLRSIAGVLPDSTIELRGVAVPFAATGDSAAMVLTLGLDVSTARAARGQRVRLTTYLFDPQGRARGEFQQDATVCDVPDLCEITTVVPVSSGRQSVRVSLELPASATAGSLYVDLNVPNFTRDPVSLSGLVLDATPASSRVTDAAVRDLLPVVPTIRRIFSASDVPTLFFRIHQRAGRTPGAVTRVVRLTNMAGTVVWESVQVLDGQAFANTRHVDQRVTLDLENHPQGNYTLEVDVRPQSGSVVTRRLSIEIRH